MSNTTRRPKAPTLVEIGPNGTTPAPYYVGRRSEWVCCETEDCQGFCAELIVGPSVLTRNKFIDDDDAITVYQTAWNELPEDDRPDGDSPRDRQIALIAPFVKAWNCQAENLATGEMEPIPTPAVGGPDVFALIGLADGTWLLNIVVMAIRSGKAPSTVGRFWQKVSAVTAATTSAGNTAGQK